MSKAFEFISPPSVPWPRVQIDPVVSGSQLTDERPATQPTVVKTDMAASRSTQLAAVVFFLFSLFLLAVCAWLLWRVWGLAREVRALRALDSQRRVMSLASDKASPQSSQLQTSDATISGSVSPTPEPTPTIDPITRLPTDWEKFAFPDVKLTMYAPPGYRSDLQLFDSGEYTVRFWQGSDASAAKISLAIKPNWDNTGDAKSAQRTIPLSRGIVAGKIDPPSKTAGTDIYKTNFFFAYSSKVYYLTCQHNWDMALYKQCETMLKTLELGS